MDYGDIQKKKKKSSYISRTEAQLCMSCKVLLFVCSNTSLCQEAELDELLILLNVVNPAGLVWASLWASWWYL